MHGMSGGWYAKRDAAVRAVWHDPNVQNVKNKAASARAN